MYVFSALMDFLYEIFFRVFTNVIYLQLFHMARSKDWTSRAMFRCTLMQFKVCLQYILQHMYIYFITDSKHLTLIILGENPTCQFHCIPWRKGGQGTGDPALSSCTDERIFCTIKHFSLMPMWAPGLYQAEKCCKEIRITLNNYWCLRAQI